MWAFGVCENCPAALYYLQISDMEYLTSRDRHVDTPDSHTQSSSAFKAELMHNGNLVCVHVDCMISSLFINQSSSQKRERSDTYCNCMSQLLKRECENSLLQMDFSDKTQNEDAHSVHQSSGYPLSHTVTCESICQPYTHLFIHPVKFLYVTSSNAVKAPGQYPQGHPFGFLSRPCTKS